MAGLLKHSDGTILKPGQSHVRGLREHQFYQWIFGSEQHEDDLITLKKFLPKYLGTWSTPEHPDGMLQVVCIFTTGIIFVPAWLC